jgi:hypothetical protein
MDVIGNNAVHLHIPLVIIPSTLHGITKPSDRIMLLYISISVLISQPYTFYSYFANIL